MLRSRVLENAARQTEPQHGPETSFLRQNDAGHNHGAASSTLPYTFGHTACQVRRATELVLHDCFSTLPIILLDQ